MTSNYTLRKAAQKIEYSPSEEIKELDDQLMDYLDRSNIEEVRIPNMDHDATSVVCSYVRVGEELIALNHAMEFMGETDATIAMELLATARVEPVVVGTGFALYKLHDVRTALVCGRLDGAARRWAMTQLVQWLKENPSEKVRIEIAARKFIVFFHVLEKAILSHMPRYFHNSDDGSDAPPYGGENARADKKYHVCGMEIMIFSIARLLVKHDIESINNMAIKLCGNDNLTSRDLYSVAIAEAIDIFLALSAGDTGWIKHVIGRRKISSLPTLEVKCANDEIAFESLDVRWGKISEKYFRSEPKGFE